MCSALVRAAPKSRQKRPRGSGLGTRVFVAAGHDDDFGRDDRAYDRWLSDPHHRPSEMLRVVGTDPFHAVPVYPGAGASIGPSFVRGFVAAKHAAHADDAIG